MSNVTFVCKNDKVVFLNTETGDIKEVFRAENPRLFVEAFKVASKDILTWDDVENISEEEVKFHVEYFNGDFVVNSDGLFMYGEKYSGNSDFEQNVMGLVQKGVDVTRFLKMVERLLNNPYEDVWHSFFNWLARTNLFITEEGKVLGYKSVRPDFKDWHTGTIDNSVGCSPRPLPHWKCDRNSYVECSEGYHIGTYEYAYHFNNRPGRNIVLCEFDPEDVMVVPNEGDCGKIRVRHYKVVTTHEGSELPSNVPLVKYNGEEAVPELVFVDNYFRQEDDYQWDGDKYRDDMDYDEEYSDYEDDDFDEDDEDYDDFSWDDDEEDEFDDLN